MSQKYLAAVIIILVFGIPLMGQGIPMPQDGEKEQMEVMSQKGVWIGSGIGMVIPVGRAMRGNNNAGFSLWVNLENTRYFSWLNLQWNIGGDIGVQSFNAGTKSSMRFMPVTVFVSLDMSQLMESISSPWQVNVGAGIGLFPANRGKITDTFFGLVVPFTIEYKTSPLTQLGVQICAYEVLGQVGISAGTSDYGNISFTFDYYLSQ